jgi:hypothetical protein
LGPERNSAAAFLSDGGFSEPSLTFSVQANRPVVALYAAAHVASGSPPDPGVTYRIDYRGGSGTAWKPLVADWNIPRRGDEPGDFWSQSFCYGNRNVNIGPGVPIEFRFGNDGGKRYLRAEAHLIEQTGPNDPVTVTYAWTDSLGDHRASHVFDGAGQWPIATAEGVRTRWVEFAPLTTP